MCELTEEQKQEYMISPGHCPFCRSVSISANDHVSVDGNQAWQNIECGKCGKTWTDVYQLTGVESDNN